MTLFLSGQDEDIKPVSISHEVDLMASADGEGLEFYYNYLVYRFEGGDLQLSAKHYLDNPGVVSIPLALSLPLSDFVRQVLVYLSLRYNSIEVPSEDGYVPLPDDVAQVVGTAVAQRIANQP